MGKFVDGEAGPRKSSILKTAFLNLIDGNRTKVRIVLVVLLGTIIGLAIPAILDKYVFIRKDGRLDCQLPPAFRLNSMPNMESDEKTCKDNFEGCWDSSVKEHPYCFHPHPARFYYTVTEKTKCEQSGDAQLRFYAKVEAPLNANHTSSTFVQNLIMTVEEANDHRVIVNIFNAHQTNFEPYLFLKYSKKESPAICNRPKRLYDLSNTPNETNRLFVNVKRKDGKSIFNTDFGALIFKTQQLEITTVLPSGNLYGLGQGRHTTLRHNLTVPRNWTLFAGQDKSWGHGVHPFYLCVEDDGKAHGVLLEHTNALEVTTQNVPSVTYKSTGSSLRFHILLGPTPKDVIRQLTDLVGRPAMPPYWALGHHVCRSGKVDPRKAVRDLLNKTIPQESDCFQDTLGLKNEWDSFSNFVEDLKGKIEKFLLVQVPHIPTDGTYSNNSIDNMSIKGVKGTLNGINVVYPNYFNNLTEWCQKRLEAGNQTFHGYFLSNNTPVDERPKDSKCSTNLFNSPPYVPGKLDLWNKTICLDSCHESNCNRLKDRYHYNLHNIYGYQHMKTMHTALSNMRENQNNPRPFLLSLSTFTGSGQYGGQFSTGFNSTWIDMKIAMVQSLEFNLFGIPLVGASVCGYHFRKDGDLCSRWVQLASFQPLVMSYHHSESLKESSSPLVMDDFVPSVAVASLSLRYELLPYLYTLFHIASVDGTPVIRPLFMEFPEDPQTRGIDEQFMWGSGLLISPIFKNHTKVFPVYFPEGIWYEFYNGNVEHQGDHGSYKNLTALDYMAQFHVQGGNIISSQGAFQNTRDGRNSNYTLRVALGRGKEPSAEGQLYIDDGETQDSNSFIVDMLAQKNTLKLTPKFKKGKYSDFDNVPYNLIVDTVYIFGIKLSNPNYSCFCNNVVVRCEHKELYGTINFESLSIDLRNSNNVTWTTEH